MKRFLIGLLAGLMLGSITQGQNTNNDNSTATPFSEGGTVRLKLSSGDYSVRAGTSDRILVQWSAGDSADVRDLKKIRVRSERTGNVVTIKTDGPTNHVRFTIEVPARSDLYLRMRAGDVRIDGVEGHKDIRMTAGDLRIDLLPASYSSVHASVKFGDLQARPLGISKEGIFSSLNWNGSGKYKLNASLFAGDVILTRGETVH
jgi:hypothetical protein